MSYYWYISTSKIAQLHEDYGKRLRDVFGGVSLAIKTPVVAGDLKLSQPAPGLAKQVRRVERGISDDPRLVDYDSLTSGGALPPFFRFEGACARLVNDREFWLAGSSAATALVLVGATRHATGGGSASGPDLMSPSLDPLSVIMGLVSPDVRARPDADAACSYAWQVIMRHNSQHQVSLPRVQGIAVTVATVPAVMSQVRRAGGTGIDRIVVGTPLFVRQI